MSAMQWFLVIVLGLLMAGLQMAIPELWPIPMVVGAIGGWIIGMADL